MELPHIGKNCAIKQCNRLDFLPVKCDSCHMIFCIEHYKYDTHNCENSKDKDSQVPVCPICSEPVPGKKGQLPDIAVSQHIDQYCRQNSKIKDHSNKPKSNLQACCFKSCRQKDLIYLECSDCMLKFCVKHRHPSDHSCTGPRISSNWQNFKGSCSSHTSSGIDMIMDKAHKITKSGQAALGRIASNTKRHTNNVNANEAVRNLQGTLSEQEALAIAISDSKANGHAVSDKNIQESEDRDLAKALHQSQVESRNRNSRSDKDNCTVM